MKYIGYICAIILWIGWSLSGGTNETALIASGLFAIAGAISCHK